MLRRSLAHFSPYSVNKVRSFSTVDATKRPFKILGLQQIAIGGLDKKVLSDFWVTQLGINKVGNYRSEVIL